MRYDNQYRLSIDLGAQSLGLCLLALDASGAACGIIAMGSRIFSDGRDPKSGASLAVDRRVARAMRTRRDRYLRRRKALLREMTAIGLFPADKDARRALQGLDPYELRARALDEKLPLHELGRALFHLNQRRGFKSNRKTDKGDESGKIAVGSQRLRDAIADRGARTLGEFLHQRRSESDDPNNRASVRTRMRQEAVIDTSGERPKEKLIDAYEFYPDRSFLAHEFDEIMEAQQPHYPDVLTDAVRAQLYEVIFHQRPLKAPKIGKCTLVHEEERLPKAHPLFQRRRLLEEVNALRIVLPGQNSVELTLEQRNVLLLKLQGAKKVKFESLRKLLKLDPAARFNKESEKRPDLIGDEVFAEMSHASRFGKAWAHYSPEKQWSIIERVLHEEKEDELLGWLKTEHGLDDDHAKAVANAKLPPLFGRFGLTATTALIEELEREVITYNVAVEKCGWHHSDMRTGEIFEELPYYGVALERHIMPGTADPNDRDEATRIGRITNPTVHIGLNQLRRVINRIIAVHGRPKEIAIELARDIKLSQEQKKEIDAENNRNRIRAEKASEFLIKNGYADTGANRAKLRLWEELNFADEHNRCCIYSGERITLPMLFSDEVEVDHILPFSATLDDSNANKIICIRKANRFKGNQSPYDAWHRDPAKWEEIATLSARLPKNKRWRFEPGAMQRFVEEGGFLSRNLVDTQYLSRMAREYLSVLYPDKGEGSSHVWVSPGRLTELVRRKLRLNDLLPDHNFGGGADQAKNRLDHRHHAIDAFVIGIVDRSLLQRMARASGLSGSEGRDTIEVPEPWAGFRDELRAKLAAITVSHRVDHGTVSKTRLPKGGDQTAAQLHNDTAYGLTGLKDARGNTLVVTRKPLSALKPDHLGPDPNFGVRDLDLREALARFTYGTSGKDFTERLAKFPHLGPLPYRRIRRVRLIEPLKVIEIRDAEGRAYKGYKGDSNYRFDVWEMPDGKWVPEVVTMFDAHRADWVSEVRKSCPTARKMLSVQINDLLAIEDNGQRRLMRAVKFGQNGQLTLAETQEGGSLKSRDADAGDPFKYISPTASGLKRLQARQVRIDELGRVFDPGFPPRKARRKTRKP